MAVIKVLDEFCKGCGLCLSVCPRNVLAISKRSNEKGYYVAEVIAPDDCIGCGLCGLMCPDVALQLSR